MGTPALVCSGDVRVLPGVESTKARLLVIWVSGGVGPRLGNSVGCLGHSQSCLGAVVGLLGLDVAGLLTLLALFGGVVLGGSRTVFT